MEAMTLTLTLPHELERRLSSEADRLGLAVEQYALRLLGAEQATAQRPRTGAELVAYWQREGVIGSRKDVEDSQAYARELRRQAETRSRE